MCGVAYAGFAGEAITALVTDEDRMRVIKLMLHVHELYTL